MSKTLLVIDVQNDYFAGGRYPLWNTEPTLAVIESAIGRARANGVPVVLVQHVADPEKGPSPFFTAGTPGAEIHPRIAVSAPDAPVVIKRHADSFFGTTLEATLAKLGTTELLVCGMMTQNCVTHTAISKSAEKYAVTVLSDACTTVDQMIHKFAIGALTTRLKIASAGDAIGA
jgi:nicotinamidase-related amidase